MTRGGVHPGNPCRFEAVNDVEIDDDGGRLHFDLAFDFAARVFRFDVSGIVCPAP